MRKSVGTSPVFYRLQLSEKGFDDTKVGGVGVWGLGSILGLSMSEVLDGMPLRHRRCGV